MLMIRPVGTGPTAFVGNAYTTLVGNHVLGSGGGIWLNLFTPALRALPKLLCVAVGRSGDRPQQMACKDSEYQF